MITVDVVGMSHLQTGAEAGGKEGGQLAFEHYDGEVEVLLGRTCAKIVHPEGCGGGS